MRWWKNCPIIERNILSPGSYCRICCPLWWWIYILMFKLQQENWKERKQQQKFTTKISNVRRFWRSDSMLMFFFLFCFFSFRIWRSRVFSLCLCLCSAKCDLPVFLSYIHPKDRLGKGSISPDCTSHKQYQLYSSSAHLHIVQ